MHPAQGTKAVVERRGLAILILVLLLSLITLAVFTLGAASRDDLTIAVQRIETSRAFLAAESATRVSMIRVVNNDPISSGDTVVTLLEASGTVIAVDSPAGVFVVEGRSGRAHRRLEWVVGP